MSNEEKTKQLGMPIGTATAILRKNIMFSLIKQLQLNNCFRCGKEIKIVDDLSIEHKEAWLHSGKPVELFFSLDNIAFSHLKCNISTKTYPNSFRHGTISEYRRGCRCHECRKAKSITWDAYKDHRR